MDDCRDSYADVDGQRPDGDSGADNDNDACKDAYQYGYDAGMESGKAYASGYRDGLADARDAPLVSDDSYDASDKGVWKMCRSIIILISLFILLHFTSIRAVLQ